MSQLAATVIGFGAVLLWSGLALLAVLAEPVPPLQLTALCFSICAFVSLLIHRLRNRPLSKAFDLPPVLWLIGIVGLFGFHVGFFVAIRQAPPAEAGLIAGSWPLLLVLGSALLPGEKLRVMHVAGVLTAMIGAIILITSQANISFSALHVTGFASALIAAFCWSGYSLGQRVYGDVSTDTIIGLCVATALVAWTAHVIFEDWTPLGTVQMLAIVGLGLGPVGGAFFLWDIGCKHGDIQLLGTLSYGEALLSTIFLVLSGVSLLTTSLFLGAILITLGSAIAAMASAWQNNKSSSGDL